MASITSLMNSNYNTSSIYGSRNVLSGLASGMDTETMIENAVSGIKMKIQNLLKKRTKVEWQQEAYRSIIDKAVNFNTKYTSYSSKTNLLSSSFFTNAVNTVAKGTYADKITATGKSTSDIKINAVKRMASAASCTVSGLGGLSGSITGDFDITGKTTTSAISGSLTFQYGGANGTSFDIRFDELENVDEVKVFNADGSVKESATSAEKLAQAIQNKLGEITYSYRQNGVQETTTADKAIKVSVVGGEIRFSDGLGNGNNVSISGGSGVIVTRLGISEDDTSIDAGGVRLTQDVNTVDYLETKALSLTFNGATKSISLADVIRNAGGSDASNEKFQQSLQDEIDKAFGAGKVTVGWTGEQNEDGELINGRLSFTAEGKGNTLSVGGSAIEAMGFKNGDANYINTGSKLGDIFGDSFFNKTSNRLKAEGSVTQKTGAAGVYHVDSKGNKVEMVDGTFCQVDDTGKALYDFRINGTSIRVTEDTTLESLMSSINSNANAGVKVSYSRLTNEFQFTATETGANSKIEFGGLAKDLFGAPEVSGSDSFSDVYGLNVESGNRVISFDDPDNFPFGVSEFYVTSDMTEDDILEGLSALFEERGLDYTASYEDGQLVIKDGNDEMVDTQIIKRVMFALPGENEIGILDVTSDMTMGDVVKELNMVFDSAHTASIDEHTGQIVVQANGQKVDLVISEAMVNSDGEEVAGQELKAPFSGTYTAGQDAILDVTINGTRFEDLTRSGNSIDIDGLTITLKGTFNEDGLSVGKDGAAYESVTFETTTDTDKIINAIRDFVNDYNEMVTELKGAYSTQPAYNSSNSRYEPLTAEQEDSMTESEIAAYNEKAKQGILFGDTTLSSMYSKLLSAIQPGGSDGQILREIGIGTSYENGLTTLSLDEDKLRNALESDLDKVKNAFAKTRESGSSSDGLMQTLQNNLNTYVRTTGEPKGALIVRAGSVKAPTSLNNNSLNTQINGIDKEIERWQNKMSAQIDRYTTQFSRLEQLIAAMNSQSSAMAGLLGGYEGY